jgi:hypothetical protein
MGGPPVAVETACCQIITQGFAQDRNIQRFPRTSAIGKNMVFNVKKMIFNGVDLTLQQKGRKEVIRVD